MAFNLLLPAIIAINFNAILWAVRAGEARSRITCDAQCKVGEEQIGPNKATDEHECLGSVQLKMG